MTFVPFTKLLLAAQKIGDKIRCDHFAVQELLGSDSSGCVALHVRHRGSKITDWPCFEGPYDM